MLSRREVVPIKVIIVYKFESVPLLTVSYSDSSQQFFCFLIKSLTRFLSKDDERIPFRSIVQLIDNPCVITANESQVTVLKVDEPVSRQDKFLDNPRKSHLLNSLGSVI